MPAASSGPYSRTLFCRASQLSLCLPATMIFTSTPRWRGLDQRVDRHLVGHEVRVRDVDRASCADDREVVHDADGRGAGLRRAHDRLHRQPAGDVRLQRVVQLPRHQLARALEPVLREPRLQRRDGGPLDADLDVAPVVRVLRVPAPVVGDAGAAGEGDAAVDDQRLAMGPMVEAGERVPADRVVPGELAAARFERLEDLLADPGGADGVQQDLDPHAGSGAVAPGPARTGGRPRLPSRCRPRS